MAAHEYPLLEPPFRVKPFREMSTAEAREHFDWFVNQLEPRCLVLADLVRRTGGKGVKLDRTPGSLVPLWAWATKRLSRGDANDEFSTETMCLIADIGFYLAATIMKTHPQVKWALWTERPARGYFDCHHKPYLTGFESQLVPVDVVTNCARRALRGAATVQELKEVYDVWLEDLQSAD